MLDHHHFVLDKFPQVTSMLDGTPIPTRWRGKDIVVKKTGNNSVENFAGKYRLVCFKMEVWITMLGVPFAFRGPIPGSHHDVVFFGPDAPPLPFKHLKLEMFLADSGYFGYPHMMLPFKKMEQQGKEDFCSIDRDEEGQAKRLKRVVPSLSGTVNGNITLKRYWNKVHSKYRSRIERNFAWWLKYAVTQQCNKSPEFLNDAFTILIAWEFFLQQTKGHGHYPKEKLSTQDWTETTWCECGVHKSVSGAKEAYQKRRPNAVSLRGKRVIPIPRPPKHAKKDTQSKFLWPLDPVDTDSDASKSD